MSRLHNEQLKDDRPFRERLGTRARSVVETIIPGARVRAPRHPEKTHDLLRMKAAIENEKLVHWRVQRGWILWLFDGVVTRRREYGGDVSYEEAVGLRDAEMATGSYEKAWLERRED